MIKLEHTDVYGWKAAIRELYNGKGVRWVSKVRSTVVYRVG